MDKIAAGPIGAVTSHPILLARLRLILGVSHNVSSQLMLAMSKLTEVSIETCALLLEVATDLSLEARIGALIDRAGGVAIPAESVEAGCSLIGRTKVHKNFAS